MRVFLPLICLAVVVFLASTSGVLAEDQEAAAATEVVIHPTHPTDPKPESSREAAACDKDDAACAEDEAACAEGEAEVAAEESDEPATEIVHATHKQTKLIAVNTGDLKKAKLRSFCLTPDGVILAACGAEPGEVRLFSATGDYLDSWQLPVDPEAINVGSDGYVYVAGAGELFRMSAEGEIVHQVESPHFKMTDEKREQIRQSIIEQQQKSVERYSKMADRYADRYNQMADAAKVLKQNGVTLNDSQQRHIDNAKRMMDQWKQILDQIGAKELTEEQLEKRVASSLKSQAAVASISEADGEVFLASREATGYGFCVWRMTSEFTDGEVIAKGLRGCCGQMDVQCCENGVYVAENSRHRVYHVSRTGEELGQWGRGSRQGLEGFGSCCNPMNVAFGPERSVYTAESGTGRIKRYSPEGKLIELVGKVDVVPGCKKVSIAVDHSGDRVYMMDITRHHIVLMERLAEGEEASYTETRTVQADEADEESSEVSLQLKVAG